MISKLKLYYKTLGFGATLSAIFGKLFKNSKLMKFNKKMLKYPIFLRVPSSDVDTYEQVFVREDYKFDIKKTPKIILDAGANVGLASIYFANKYPHAKIIALEPEADNYEVLKKNIAAYPNITGLYGALWFENTRLNLVDPDLGSWGFMTQEKTSSSENFGDFVQDVQAYTVDKIIQDFGIDQIDILKIDIEGAEREVFNDTSAWIDKIDVIIAELHDRLKPGCESSFYTGTKDFNNKWFHGENVFLTRN